MINKDKVKHLWRIAPRGIILWNAFIMSLLTITAFVSIEVFLVAQAIGSVIAFVTMLNDDISGNHSPKNFWTIMTLVGLIVCLFIIIVNIFQFSYKWTFGYLIEQDEIRREKYRKEQRINNFFQFKLESDNRKKRIKKLDEIAKNNQKLLGN